MSDCPVRDVVLKAVQAAPGARASSLHQAVQREAGEHIIPTQVYYALDCLEEEGLIVGKGLAVEPAKKVWYPRKSRSESLSDGA